MILAAIYFEFKLFELYIFVSVKRIVEEELKTFADKILFSVIDIVLQAVDRSIC